MNQRIKLEQNLGNQESPHNIFQLQIFPRNVQAYQRRHPQFEDISNEEEEEEEFRDRGMERRSHRPQFQREEHNDYKVKLDYQISLASVTLKLFLNGLKA